MQVISAATVPIITFVDKVCNIPCDLSVNNDNNIHNAVLLNAYTQIDARLLPLYVAVKKWAKAAGIIDSKHNRLASK